MRILSRILPLLAVAIMIFPASATAGISIEGGLTHEKVSQPGQPYQGVITIKNQGDSPQELKIYQTDYRFNHEGATIYGDPGQNARTNARWITFSPSRLTIPPKDTAVINYTIQVPADASLAGTYWSMLMIEGIPESAPESSQHKKPKELSLGITQVMRYGIQMITHIGETGTKKISFLKTTVLKEQDTRILQADVQNDGDRMVRPQLWAELYTSAGVSLGRFPGEQYRLLPTTSKRFHIDITKVPPGTYKALMVADCGDDDLFGVSYTLKLEH